MGNSTCFKFFINTQGIQKNLGEIKEEKMVNVSKVGSYVYKTFIRNGKKQGAFFNLETNQFASAAEMAAKRAGKLPVPISHYQKTLPVVIENTVKKPSIWKKLAKFGLIGAGLGLLGLGGLYLFKKYKDSQLTPVPPSVIDRKLEPDPKPTPKPNPAPVKPEPEPKPEPKPEKKIHVVKKGDNLWNIAKQYLKDQKADPNYNPSDKEILEKTEELMKLNNKQYKQPLPSDSKNRIVEIELGEKIKLN